MVSYINQRMEQVRRIGDILVTYSGGTTVLVACPDGLDCTRCIGIVLSGRIFKYPNDVRESLLTIYGLALAGF